MGIAQHSFTAQHFSHRQAQLQGLMPCISLGKNVSPTGCSSLATSLDVAHAVPTVQFPGFQQLRKF